MALMRGMAFWSISPFLLLSSFERKVFLLFWKFCGFDDFEGNVGCCEEDFCNIVDMVIL